MLQNDKKMSRTESHRRVEKKGRIVSLKKITRIIMGYVMLCGLCVFVLKAPAVGVREISF